ncbi:MAG TPA: cupin domain-containing protein [Candidatus Saccharimonadales bacterium]|nr:cupin domain-containing protein [Candidatus Saccharimonadales bacterium]
MNIASPQHARLAAVQPGGADPEVVPGFTAAIRLTSGETGSISIVEHVFAPKALVPPHLHTREDEISYVVEGEIWFRSDGREVSLRAGGYIVKPRGELHAMWNAGSEAARMIEIISPAGFERYFVELAEAVAAAGGPHPSVIAPVAERYGLSFDFSEVPDLVRRFGLHGLGPRSEE